MEIFHGYNKTGDLPAACVVHVDAACCMLLHFRLQEARRANAAAKALKHGDVTGGTRLYDNDSKSSKAPTEETWICETDISRVSCQKGPICHA